jgi:hypothetical protein
MKKIILFTGLFAIAVVLGSCGSDTTTNPGTTDPYFFKSDLLEYSNDSLGQNHVFFKTTKRGKVIVEFTGETDAGTDNFIVSIRAMSDTNSLAAVTIYQTSNSGDLNQAHTITSPDISTLDPLYLGFAVALSRPPSGTKYVRIKSIKVKEG